MIDIDLQTNIDEIQKYLKKLPVESFDTAKLYFSQAAFAADAKIKRNATDILKVRSGALKRSIRFEVKGTSIATLRASVYAAGKVGGQTIKYAPIHEYGGTIRAKNAYHGVQGGPYLNIPARANKTASGVTRMGAREVFNQGGYIVGKVVYLNGAAMFFLVKQVKIPARLGMTEAVDNVIPTLLSNIQRSIGEY